MKKFLLVGLAIVTTIFVIELTLRVGGSVLAFVQEQQNRTALARKSDYRILALGESMTAPKGDSLVATEDTSWPRQLEQILSAGGTGPPPLRSGEASPLRRVSEASKTFSVVNKAVPGITSAGIVGDLPQNLTEYKPDIVVVMMGINDGYDAFKQIEGFIPNNPGILEGLRVYRLGRMVWQMIQKKKTSQSIPVSGSGQEIKMLEQTVAENPTNDEARIALGNLYAIQTKFDQAEKLFHDVLTRNEKSTLAYVGLGNLFMYQNRLDEAEHMYEEAIALDPQSDMAYTQLGHLYSNQFQDLKAEEAFAQALDFNPDNVVAHIKLGNFYRDQKRYDEAEEMAEKALSQHPESVWPLIELEKVYRSTGRTKEADEVARKAWNLDTTLQANYRRLRDIVMEKRIPLIAVQYPLRSVEQLKALLGDEGVKYVDNEKVFTDALRQGSYEDYFVDQFAGDFGHMTKKGSELLAINVARSILSYVVSINRNMNCDTNAPQELGAIEIHCRPKVFGW